MVSSIHTKNLAGVNPFLTMLQHFWVSVFLDEILFFVTKLNVWARMRRSVFVSSGARFVLLTSRACDNWPKAFWRNFWTICSLKWRATLFVSFLATTKEQKIRKGWISFIDIVYWGRGGHRLATSAQWSRFKNQTDNLFDGKCDKASPFKILNLTFTYSSKKNPRYQYISLFY